MSKGTGMSSRELSEAILDGGIRSINFFNGRLLSGEDLTQERAANRTVDWRLGQALGAGIACGLEVTEAIGVSTMAAPVVAVAAGLAVNSQGQTLALPVQTNVALTRAADTPPAKAGTFSVCLPPQGGAVVAGTGVYLLVLSPASGGDGRAPTSGLDCCEATCNTKYNVEGVQFRLVPLPLALDELQVGPLLRNHVARRCFGIDDPGYLQTAQDPFNAKPAGYGILATLRQKNNVTDCDVPLAVLSWTTAGGIDFIDLWSVRRRITHRSGAARWHAWVGDRLQSEAEAMYLQFQEQLASILATEQQPQTIAAGGRFGFLPPVGILPLSRAGGRSGFSYQVFFGAHVYRQPFVVGGEGIVPLVRAALPYGPIRLDQGEMVWLYEVRDNRDPRVYGATAAATAPQQYLIFTSGHVPFQGQARLDVARADFTNYPPRPFLTKDA
jgi:hypothetical protein